MMKKKYITCKKTKVFTLNTSSSMLSAAYETAPSLPSSQPSPTHTARFGFGTAFSFFLLLPIFRWNKSLKNCGIILYSYDSLENCIKQLKLNSNFFTKMFDNMYVQQQRRKAGRWLIASWRHGTCQCAAMVVQPTFLLFGHKQKKVSVSNFI